MGSDCCRTQRYSLGWYTQCKNYVVVMIAQLGEQTEHHGVVYYECVNCMKDELYLNKMVIRKNTKEAIGKGHLICTAFQLPIWAHKNGPWAQNTFSAKDRGPTQSALALSPCLEICFPIPGSMCDLSLCSNDASSVTSGTTLAFSIADPAREVQGPFAVT